jgi:hypothetical protein
MERWRCADAGGVKSGQEGRAKVICSSLYLILQTVPFWRWPVHCRWWSGSDRFFPRNRDGVKECLQRRLAEAPAASNGINQIPALVGNVIRAKPHNGAPAGYVATFIAVKQPWTNIPVERIVA